MNYLKRKNSNNLKTESCRQADLFKASYLSRGNFRNLVNIIKNNMKQSNLELNKKVILSPTKEELFSSKNNYNKLFDNKNVDENTKYKSCSKIEIINNLKLSFNSKNNVFPQKIIKEYNLLDYNTDNIFNFFLYQEDDIGFNKNWQRNLRVTEMDDDVETDNEQLNAAARHIRKEVKEGVYYFLQGEGKIRNSNRFKYVNKKSQDSKENEKKNKRCILFDFDRNF